MHKKHISLILIIIMLTVLPTLLTACDLFPFINDSYRAEVEINGVDSPDHYDVFKVAVEGREDRTLSWVEGDVEGDNLSGSIPNMEGSATLTLIIEHDHIEGRYKADSESIEVDEDNRRAEFTVQKYQPQITSLEISGPDVIYAPQERESDTEYTYEAKILDQHDKLLAEEKADWELEENLQGIDMSQGTVAVAWDVSPGSIMLRASSREKPDLFQSKEIAVEYLSEEERDVYDDALQNLDGLMEAYDLEALKDGDEIDLPGTVEGYDEVRGENREFDVLWNADNHQALTLENQKAVVDSQTEETGYITAFLQPQDEDMNFTQMEEDPRQRKYEVTVVIPVKLKTSFEFEHSFPAAEVDDFYETHSVDSAGPLSADVREEERLSKTASELPSPPETNEIIIGLQRGMGAMQETGNALQEKNYEVIDKNETMNALLVRLPAGKTAEEAIGDVRTLSSVRYAEPNEYFHALSVNHPDDNMYSHQWHYPQIRLPQTWDVTQGSDEISIAVLDTGVNVDHEDMGDNVDLEAGYNFREDNDDVTDKFGHGTHIAGTISANSNNNRGVAGVMWDSRIIPVKVLDDDGFGPLWTIAEGILYSAGLEGNQEKEPPAVPADIINLSLGSPIGSTYLQESVERVAREDVIMIASAGNLMRNEDRNTLMYPAAYEEVISVGAVDLNYPGEPQLTDYSYYHADMDLLAPGGAEEDSNNSGEADGILSTFLNDEYALMNGTSMAAAHVSGVAGLMLSEGIPAREIRDTLKDTAMDLSTVDYGEGLINSYWAVNHVDSFQVELYRDDGGEMDIVKEKTIAIDENKAEFELARTGDYKIKAWVDVQNTGSLDPGDYKGTYGTFRVDSGEEYDVKLDIQEQGN